MTRHPPPDPHRLRALAAQAQLWLVGLLAWIAEAFGAGRIGRALRAEVRRDLFDLRRGLVGVLVLLALPQLERRLSVASAPHPPGLPRGVRRGRICVPIRAAQRLLRLPRGLRGALAALKCIVDDLDAWTARMARRLNRDDVPAALVLAHACADAMQAQAQAAPACADTS